LRRRRDGVARLDDPGGDKAGHHSALCATHAGRLRPPVGWSFQDRRTSRSPSDDDGSAGLTAIAV
jgi:hypothetical protein